MFSNSIPIKAIDYLLFYRFLYMLSATVSIITGRKFAFLSFKELTCLTGFAVRLTRIINWSQMLPKYTIKIDYSIFHNVKRKKFGYN